MAIIQALKDQSNNIIYPQTHITAVLNSSGDTLDTILATKVSTNNVGQYLPPATTSALGGVKVDGVTITATSNGVISAVPGLNIKVVQTLPTTGISTTTIYLLANGGTGTNIYDEYVYVNNKWEKIGTTDIDLSEYAKKTELPTLTSDLTNDSGYITKTVSNLENYTLTTGLAVVALSGSYNDLSNKPTIPDVSGFMTKSNPSYTGTLHGGVGPFGTLGAYSVALGREVFASGDYALAVGQNVTASAIHSVAFGYYSTASGHSSLAEGNRTKATGDYSFAVGSYAEANGDYAFAGGNDTRANSECQFVYGKNNIEDNNGVYAIIIGNGTNYATDRSNAYTLDWSGNGWFAGKVNVNSTADPTASQVRNITCSTSEPTSADGQNGDLWIVYEEA